jgi:hypothetical protein
MLPVLCPWHMLRPLHNPVTEQTHDDLLCRSIKKMSHAKVLKSQYYTKRHRELLVGLPYVFLMLTCKIPYVHSILSLLCQKKQILLEEATN